MEAIPVVGPARVLALVLVAGSALAQPPAARVRREQSLTVTGNPADPVPEIHTAPEVATLVLFDAEIQPAGLEVDRARVKLEGSGPRFLLLQPVVALGPQERLILRVPYSDGQPPGSAILALVAHPIEVDTRVEVTRRPQPASACQAELAEAKAHCAAVSPTRFLREGGMGKAGVRAQKLVVNTATVPLTQDLVLEEGRAYTAETWTLVRLLVRNEGPAPWRPLAATLVNAMTQAPLRLRSVEVEPIELGPGAVGLLFVECDGLKKNEEGTFSLEVRDAAGRGVVLPGVTLQQPKEAKR